MTALTETERRKLNDLETIIERGLQTFVEVGASLAMIREQQLYKDSHETFESYVETRWGWTASRARQLIGAAEAVASVESVTTVTPANEAQARELVPVPAEKRAEVWQRAVEESGGKPTAKHVREAGVPFRPKMPTPRPKSNTDLLREQRERQAEAREAVAHTIDIKQEIRDVKREVRESSWGRLSAYLTEHMYVPPKLTREEIREAVVSDTDGGWFVTARAVRDFLNVVLEELDAAKESSNAA